MPGPLRIWTWFHGDSPGFSWDMPLWTYPEVMPLIIYNTPYPENYGPPGTGTIYPVPTHDSAGIGVFLANKLEHFTVQYNAIGREFLDYAICIPGIGAAVDGVARPIFGSSPEDDVTGGGWVKSYGPLHSFGESYNGDQMEDALDSFDSERTSRALPPPAFCHDDSEKRPGLLEALTNWKFLETGVVADKGWLLPMISGAEVRAATDVLFDGIAFTSAWTTRNSWAGDAPLFSYDVTQTVTGTPNRRLFKWLDHLLYRTRDKAYKTAKYDRLRDRYPSMLVSNWEFFARNHGTMASRSFYWDTTEYDYVADGVDFVSVEAYVLAQSRFYTGNPRGGINDWLTALELTTLGSDLADLRQIAVALAKRQIDASVNATDKPLFLWIPTTGYTEIHPTVGSWGLTYAQILEMAIYAINRGCRHIALWLNDGADPGSTVKAEIHQFVLDLRAHMETLSEGDEVVAITQSNKVTVDFNGMPAVEMCPNSAWSICIAAGGVAILDASTISNPDADIVDESRRFSGFENAPAMFALRLGRDPTLTSISDARVVCLGRTRVGNSWDAWQLLPNLLGETSVPLTTASTDLIVGSLQYTNPDPLRHVFNRQGCDQVLVGVVSALSGSTGVTTSAIVQIKPVIKGPPRAESFDSSGRQQVSSFDSGDGVMVNGVLYPVKRASISGQAAGTDAAIIAAVAQRKLRIVGMYAAGNGSAVTYQFNTKGAGAGVAITPTFARSATDSIMLLPYNPAGWMQTNTGEGLTTTVSGAGQLGAIVLYIEIP